MKQLCDFSPLDVEAQLSASERRSAKWKEDYQFLLQQRCYPQEGFIGGVDRDHRAKEKQLAKKKLKAVTQSKPAQVEHLQSDLDRSLSNNEDNQLEEEFTVPRLRKKTTTVSVTLSTKSLAKNVSAVSVSRGLSIRDQTVVIGSLIASSGGNVNDFTLSNTSTWRNNRKAQQEKHQEIVSKFVPPEHCVIHWDSKYIK